MTTTRPLVLILEDDADLAALLVRTFREHGFEAESVGLTRDFERRLAQVRPALCVLDMNLPDGPALDVMGRKLRAEAIPVIAMSGVWTEVSDRVLGLESGADDYLLKPVNPRELVARVRAVLRRAEAAGEADDRLARFGGWTADFRGHRLIAPDAEEIELSAGEVRLLRALALRPRRVQTRETLMEDAGSAAFDRGVDVRISRLRVKLREDPRNPKIIKTIYGAGYMFAPSVEWIRRAEA
ncbi:MAG: DNA-binding response regulator [Rhodovulum sulfidophilum]|uniref:DNA-binding response regulator n=1 Tax=Rhodovulum sulfidophilum TaxID=35806 RepID=A0A2W5N8Y0_RHOSU|nr:MAG: DNA-binding response regulator [Rhodovulum sulfidophilum]